MTTATKLINQALGLLGVRTAADAVSGADATIALERLNTMLDAWKAESLFAYATEKVTGSLPANTQQRTIGPTGQLVLASGRPIRIEEGSTFSVDSLDYSMRGISEAEFESTSLDSVASLGPEVFFYNPTFPNGTIKFYPLSTETVTLSLIVLVQVGTFATLTTNIDLAPGYERAIVYSLAEEVAPDFERNPPDSVVRTARNARRAIKLVNHHVPQLEVCEPPQSRYARLMAG